MDKEKAVVFALTTSVNLAKEMCEVIGLELGKCEVKHFADGEILVQLGDTVRGKDVFIVQSTCNPVSSSIMEVLICIDACKRASAKSISVITPYYGYARQDRKAQPRQPITAKLIADLLQAAGATRVITTELHAAQIQGFFNIPVDDLSVMCIISNYFVEKFGPNADDVVVVSPDHGGTTRARKVANALNCPLAIIDKRRPKPNVAEAMNLIGDVKGKKAIVVDDIVDTAGTLMAGIDMLYNNGATEVYTACAHAVLSDPAIERINNSKIVEFVCTNTIDQTENAKLMPKMRVISLAELLALTIRQIEEGRPVSEMLQRFNYDNK
ncbi:MULTISPECIES: ribose-phosphate pyrophosphokinase [unclassified Breznakia]|uniref:ribose-phosphate diphosphokinase n=1 Tax=unclassified Breznakia TaxID=2623764 RepID=UPI0024747F1E|nr:MULTISPECIES: ribose-phosphate pyrophosphokinase [unclassified Breznakia]MDH6366564.1 ribose-phosphate pyrophosphokinase [Breznakia sp. PH1-1]MDH6403657.1 ribose-phosphate pyrophosphokinase [Breznakia sp. PF1-11]MDH6411366.1 ribose-phosphate pyrophosphokinase [Breznakia sp. PFB1-11]MDH6413658.1 ribose-phosphate pyrophosphokinase [Breznakia sp. PFB1-14]MDH6415911.1 ribose-phosphate pyrophosphokinase [Breznakia sp. PFB1-4]